MTVGEHDRYLENIMSNLAPNATAYLKHLAMTENLKLQLEAVKEMYNAGILNRDEYKKELKDLKSILEKGY